ncbi:hypothetical protein BDQ17DRAFT_768573 [Cyathus striatus]|nr:hypothetical protein BDQ17DRAFT_768573 [Cyathus striatus]
MGSPSVGSERLHGPPHLETAGSELARYCGITKFHATLCDEIGGGNGMQSLIMSPSTMYLRLMVTLWVSIPEIKSSSSSLCTTVRTP